MPSNQNPVFTDNVSVLGDGTEENPLHGAPGAGTLAFNAQQNPPATPVTVATGTVVDVLDVTFDVPEGNWTALLFSSLFINNSATDIIASLTLTNFPSTKGQSDGTTPSTGAGESLSLSPLGVDSITGPITGKTYHVSVANNGASDFDVLWATITVILIPTPAF
jgi:hypothetical protein